MHNIYVCSTHTQSRSISSTVFILNLRSRLQKEQIFHWRRRRATQTTISVTGRRKLQRVDCTISRRYTHKTWFCTDPCCHTEQEWVCTNTCFVRPPDVTRDNLYDSILPQVYTVTYIFSLIKVYYSNTTIITTIIKMLPCVKRPL